MSEYQYYEFQAIDRPLTTAEMQELRSYSTRAIITATSFINHYEWGSFKGDEDAWMAKYFDAFLYLANWGTHVLKLRWPSAVLSPATARLYCPGETVSARKAKDRMVVTFVSDNEEGEDWVEGDGHLAAMLPVRDEVARGDLRALYLGWLLAVQSGELNEDDLEPPVPPNLGRLSASQSAFAEFLRVDEHLLAAACRASPNVDDRLPERRVLESWVAGLAVGEKDKMLVRLMAGESPGLARELLSRLDRERRPITEATVTEGPKRRTVGELLRAAEEQQQIAVGKAAEAAARQKREAFAERKRYLDGLVGREESLWNKIDQLAATKQRKNYAQAIERVIDLRDLSIHQGTEVDFSRQLETLRVKHARKWMFVDLLKQIAGRPSKYTLDFEEFGDRDRVQ